MRLSLALLAFILTVLPVAARAQAPELRVEPELIARPLQSATLPELQSLLNRIDAKIAALKAASLTYKYMIPMDRTRASEELRQQAQVLSTRAASGLRYCLLNQATLSFQDYLLDHTVCADEAARAWSSPEVQANGLLKTLLEALVFRTRNQLSELQAYERDLGISRLAYATAVRDYGSRLSAAEFAEISKNPAFQCNPNLGTVRLDEPSAVDGKSIPASLAGVEVQNQGALGTCYANAASVALEAITSKPNSALDLAIRYSMTHTREQNEISADFGGSFCGAVQVATREGICERQDSWIEATIQKSPAAVLALQSLGQFIGRRSALPRSDWKILSDVAPAVIPQILNLTRDRALTPIESPLVKNLGFMVSGMRGKFQITQAAAVKGLENLRNYDYTHADEYLPQGGLYYDNIDRFSETLYAQFAPGLIEVLVTSFPSLPRSFLESQAVPFIRQGILGLGSHKVIDSLRAGLAIHRVIQSALDNQSQKCGNSVLAEQVLFEVLSLADLSAKAQPAAPLDPVALVQNLFSTSTKNVNDALLYTVAPRCQVAQNRVPIQPVSCQEHKASNAAFLEAKLLQSLSHGRPLGLAYCAEVLGHISGPVSRNGNCGGHESLLTGIRYNPQTQRCDVLIWNSWGKSSAKTWIDTQRLLPFAMGLQEVNPVN